ncbi:carbohydrate-binding protein [Hymenobacter lucidus]|uniref:Carbohydrate-binding protein n=1 Tax=Hymenobacter lucidus TaxID=2880930 RepID=A0ABS8AVM0_9BACT|nr:carbohydrate-binding protein [Hymenobacter lucidus]MCB2408921.1 carbohydrate-binding protein [Hymenobacter lucidus]
MNQTTSGATRLHTLFCYLLFLGINAFTAPALGQSRVNGTTGTPLGGFGAGAVKFNAATGEFAAMTQPPADAYDFKPVSNTRFQFFSQRAGTTQAVETLKAHTVNGRPDDDAIWPLHQVNFGLLNNIQVNLTGFSPLDNRRYDNMSLPYAFYEVRLTNTAATAATAALALQWDSGPDAFSYLAGKGMASKSWAVLAASQDRKAIVSTGDGTEQEFLTSGRCTTAGSSSQGKVAVRVELAANETKTIRFVLAWYDHTDPDIAYYKNLYQTPVAVATQGLAQFEQLHTSAEQLVSRLRASNLPDWLKNQTLNTLVNLSTNSMYKKDGRVAFAEGQWTCFGTMDQMWHARQIIGQLVPFYAWQELRYWARTQMKNGQIHHDFNKMDVGPVREKRSVLVSWDDTEHTDYRKIDKWVDLNCAMIVSTYELYQLTGDRAQFEFLWPYLQKAGQRILDQVAQYGSKEYPYTFTHSENSYDAGGDPNPFNANLSAVAYKVMTILAKEKKEDALAATYQRAYDTVVSSFAARYLNEANFKLGKHSESYFGGQWLALHLKLGEIWSAEQTDFVLAKLDSYYHPYYNGLSNAKGTYDEWTPYILVHHAGLLLNTRRVNQWSVMQKDAYTRQYRNRNLVFDHPLNILPDIQEEKPVATNYRSGNQYISMPALWRNYYDITGYHRDQRTKELWITPVLPAEVNHRLEKALFVSPEGYGTVSCTESGQYFQNQGIVVETDKPVAVSTLHLADNFGQNVTVTINDKRYPFARTGTGYAKELAVQWNGRIGKKGLHIVVRGDAGSAPPALPPKPTPAGSVVAVVGAKNSAYSVLEAEAATKSAGTRVARAATGESYVTSCNNFDYIQFANVDFGDAGALTFVAQVASIRKGSTIEIVLDNVAGEAVGNCSIPTTAGAEVWTTASCRLTKITGVHDVILRFSGTTSEELMNIDKVTFRGTTSQNAAPVE